LQVVKNKDNLTLLKQLLLLRLLQPWFWRYFSEQSSLVAW
jgi:hypothetical protein